MDLKRKVGILAVLFLLIALLVGCGNNADVSGQSFDAVILEKTEKALMVEPMEGSWARSSSDRIRVSIDRALFTDESGATISADVLSVGSTVAITINGGIAESYPAQAEASKVVLVASPATASDVSDCVASIVNPMQEQDSADFSDTTGFVIEDYPGREGLRPERFFAYLISDDLSDNFAEIYYRGDASQDITFRVAKDKGQALAGVYEEFRSSEEIGSLPITVKESDNNMLATWCRDGYAFSVYLMNCSREKALPVIQELADTVTIATK